MAYCPHARVVSHSLDPLSFLINYRLPLWWNDRPTFHTRMFLRSIRKVKPGTDHLNFFQLPSIGQSFQLTNVDQMAPTLASVPVGVNYSPRSTTGTNIPACMHSHNARIHRDTIHYEKSGGGQTTEDSYYRYQKYHFKPP